MRLSTDRPLLYVITDGRSRPATFAADKMRILSVIEMAVVCGVELVQIREKFLEAKQLFEVATDAATIASGSSTRILLNERFDIALAAKADGVHLPSNAMPADTVRGRVPQSFLVGVSTHSESEIARASGAGADLATYGPVYPTPGKSSLVGVTGLSAACRKFPDFPIIALGGINQMQVPEVLDAGAAGIAAIRMFSDPHTLCTVVSGIRSRRNMPE